MDWQPIVTAPRDGETPILICRVETDDMLVAWWEDEKGDHLWGTLDGN